MKRFEFQLESVRELRRQEEETVRVELAVGMRGRNDVARSIDDSRRAEQHLYEYLRSPGRTAAEMAHVARYGTLHRQKIFDLGVKLRQFDKGLELIRRRLVDARARREALDKLYERQLDEHRRAWLAAEQAELDDIAAMRHAARRRAEVGR